MRGAVGLGHRREVADQPLGGADRLRVVPRDGPGECGDDGVDLAGRAAAVHQPRLGRPDRGHRLARHRPGAHLACGHHGEQFGGHRRRREPPGDLRQAEQRVVSRYHQVAPGQQCHAEAESRAADRGHGRLRQVRQRAEQPAAVREESGAGLFVRARESGQIPAVPAAAERRLSKAEGDHLDRCVVREAFQLLAQLIGPVASDGVACAGSVPAQMGDPVAGPGPEHARLIGHRFSFLW